MKSVYNGKSASEWYTRYCQEVAKTKKLSESLQSIVKHQELIGGSMSQMSTTRRIALKALKEVKDE